jgi:hypothetical protein
MRLFDDRETDTEALPAHRHTMGPALLQPYTYPKEIHPMFIRRSLTVLLFGGTLVFVPSALAHGHAATHPAKGRHCTKNGVATNRAGHANCGLHKGQPQPPATSGTGDEPTTSTGDAASGDDSSGTVTATGDQPVTSDDQGDDNPGDDAQ